MDFFVTAACSRSYHRPDCATSPLAADPGFAVLKLPFLPVVSLSSGHVNSVRVVVLCRIWLFGVCTAMRSDLQRAGHEEWWLWLSALLVTVLSGIVYFLCSFPSLFLRSGFFYEISSDQARWAIFNFLLLFDTWLIYREWLFRRLRREALTPQSTLGAQSNAGDIYSYNAFALDPVTGFYTRSSVEQRLGKEVVRARRNNVPLSLVALHLDGFTEISEQYGEDASKQILAEFANCVRRASRGCDFCTRLGTSDFLLILPECSLRDAKIVSDRLEASAIQYAGREIALNYSVSWIDYKPGEVMSELLQRAGDMLRLYQAASRDAATPLVSRS